MSLICDDIGNSSRNLAGRSCVVMEGFNTTTEVTFDSEGSFSGRNVTDVDDNVTEIMDLVQNSSISDGSNRIVPTIIVSVVSTISLATVLGNMAIVLCIVKSRNMLTVYNIYTASLALADLLVGVVVMTNMSVYSYHGYWPLGTEMCTVWILFDFTCCTVSMLHLDAIAFDRFKSVTSPLVYRTTFTKWRAVKISMGMWILGALLWLPSILWFRITDDINGKTVENDCYFLPDKYFIVGQASVAYYCPVCFMVILYLMLFNALNKRLVESKALSQNQTIYTVLHDIKNGNNKGSFKFRRPEKYPEMEGSQMTPLDKAGPSCEGTSFANVRMSDNSPPEKEKHVNRLTLVSKSRKTREKTFREFENQKISSQNSRCIRTLGAIIIVFLICWLPFIIFWPLVAFCEFCVPAFLYETSYWLAYGNSFLNPYIYFALNRDFRRAFSKVFFRRSFKQSSRSVVSNNST